MGAGPIAFNYQAWVNRFPEFSGVSSATATLYAAEASLLVGNTASGPVNDPNLLAVLLNLATAHLAWIYTARTDGVAQTGGLEQAPPLVGRITNGAEGSVSVAVDMPDQQPNAAWWNQTTYGAQVWTMMKPFRLFRYFAPRRRRYNPPARYYGNVGF